MFNRREYRRAWTKANPDKVRKYKKTYQEKHGSPLKKATASQYYKWSLRKRYGLTIGEYNALLEKQGRVCAICKRPPEDGPRGKLYVDHCHVTQKVRGLLCKLCNLALGGLRDKPEFLQAAAEYLRGFVADAK